jgi:hypothetical protein
MAERDAAPARVFANTLPGDAGAPPGVTRDPCQELADRRFSRFGKRVKQSAARRWLNAAGGAPSGGCMAKSMRHIRNGPAPPGAPSPSPHASGVEIRRENEVVRLGE